VEDLNFVHPSFDLTLNQCQRYWSCFFLRSFVLFFCFCSDDNVLEAQDLVSSSSFRKQAFVLLERLSMTFTAN